MIGVRVTHHAGAFDLAANFDAPGGVTALFGPSGAGKTTIVKAIAGLIRPEAGRITIGETVLFDSALGIHLPPHRRRIGYVFQDARLFPHMTVAQNLDYSARFGAAVTPAERTRLIEMLGLGPHLNRRPVTLSGGESSRVALGRAMMSAPRLLLLDEPLAALDDRRKAEILPYLEQLRDEIRLPMIYVSHAMAEVARLATTLVLVGQGRVQKVGPLSELMSDPAVAPLIGLREAGAVLKARVSGVVEDGLARIDTSAGPLWLPPPEAQPGSILNLRLLAQDVTLATKRPEEISALNILPARVENIRLGDGPGALVRLRAGDDFILARITRRSVAALALTPGRAVYALVKAVSVAPENFG